MDASFVCMMPFIGLFKIGFLPVRLWDVLDIVIVGYLMYQVYRLLRGNIAFSIFVGVLTLFVVWWLVNQLQMDLLAAVLRQFVSVGMIIIVVVFQQEIRRFLLFLGNTTLRQRSKLLRSIIDRNSEGKEDRYRNQQALRNALLRMSRNSIGALIVLAKDVVLDGLTDSGTEMDALITEPLLVSIFNKYGPLHDGAVFIDKGRLVAAGCILPVSESSVLPRSAGLRHRAAVGITERYGVAAFVVSEESGSISFAYQGQLTRRLTEEQLNTLLGEHL